MSCATSRKPRHYGAAQLVWKARNKHWCAPSPISQAVLGGLPFTMDKAQISLPCKPSVQVSADTWTYLLQRGAGTITTLPLAARSILCISTGVSQTVALAVEIGLVAPTKPSLSHCKVSGRFWWTSACFGSNPRKNMIELDMLQQHDVPKSLLCPEKLWW